MILTTYTIIHVIISLLGIVSGLVVLCGWLGGKENNRWAAFFLVTTVATSVTGFFFPFHHFTAAYAVGILSILVLGLAIYARQARHLAGGWRKVYVTNAAIALYLNTFVLIVQAFLKVPALKAIAPTQTEPPFKITQLIVLILFIILTVAAAIRFRGQGSAGAMAVA
jgi:hypothetical protein